MDKRIKVVFFSGLFLFLMISVLATTILTLRSTDNRSSAGNRSHQSNVYLFPSEVEQIPGSTFPASAQIVGPAGKPFGSILLTIRFNPELLTITGIQKFNSEKLALLKNSDISTANKNGTYKILLGAIDAQEPPPNPLNIPLVVFKIIKRGEGSVSVVEDQSQLVFLNQENSEMETEGKIKVKADILPSSSPAAVSHPPVRKVSPGISVAPSATINPTITHAPSPALSVKIASPPHFLTSPTIQPHPTLKEE